MTLVGAVGPSIWSDPPAPSNVIVPFSVDVERHIVAERGVEQLDNIGDVGPEGCRRDGAAGIVANVDLHGSPAR
jgi:hypothetical protein